MHIPDGFLSAPVWIASAAVSAGVVGLSVRKVGKSLEEKQVPLMGVAGAFIFAAQMVNFPIASGTSGHLGGAVLATLLLGPWPATLIMTAILIVQSLLFQDGGITALGANILNMGVVGSFAGFFVFSMIRRLFKGTKGVLIGAFLASWTAVVLGAAFASVEIGLSGTIPLGLVLPAMVGVHAVIGIGEGIVTTAALAFLLKVRKDLVYPACQPIISAASGGAA
jgi:cobalt/nickel transport system permease protein